MTTEKELITNPKLRAEHMNRIELLNKVGELVLPTDSIYATTKNVADFYGVSMNKISSAIKNRDEIFQAGVRKIKYGLLKEKFCTRLSLSEDEWNKFRIEHGISKSETNLYPKKAILLIGYILEGSPVADKLRKLAVAEDDIFEVEEVTAPVVTMPTVKSDFTLEEVEEAVKEYAKTNPVELATIPYEHKQHNDMSVPVVKQQHDELIKTQVNDENEIIVSGRELHEFLGVNSNYTTWFKRMCEYGFIEGSDFIPILEESTGGRPSYDHALKLDMAKEISMIQRNEKGKQARQYFIEAEKRYKAQQQAPAIPMASYMIGDPIERAKLWIQEEQQRMLLAETVETQVKVIEHKDEIIEKQNEIIQEKDKAIETLKGDVVKPINNMYEQAHIMSEGLSPYQMAEAIKHMVDKYDGKHNAHSTWIKLYNSYEGKYNVNLKKRKDAYVKENNLFKMSVIEYVTEDIIHISQLYSLAKEMLTFEPIKKQSNKVLSLADL